MGKIDWTRSYGTISGVVENNTKYDQDGKGYNAKGIEVDQTTGEIVDPSDLIPDEPVEDKPEPINNKETGFQREWVSGEDPPNGYVGMTHEGFKGEPEPVSGAKCDVCDFIAKSTFGLNSHKRYKHKK
jgi:hypothetical protein